jgi:hypothetical protein
MRKRAARNHLRDAIDEFVFALLAAFAREEFIGRERKAGGMDYGAILSLQGRQLKRARIG